jgi:hypothetical protein
MSAVEELFFRFKNLFFSRKLLLGFTFISDYNYTGTDVASGSYFGA